MLGTVRLDAASGVSASTSETYTYDKLMRLTSATRAGGVVGAVTYDYDGVGNFRYKSDYSTTIADAYLYTGGSCGGGPNAVKRITLAPAVGSGTRTLCYDPNGNLTDFSTAGGNGEAFAARYDHDNLPYRTVRGGVTVDLSYDADGARSRQSGADGTRLYDGAYEKLLSPAEHKIYLGDYAVLTRPVGGLPRVNYLLKDRLGSVDAVTDSAGTLVETRGSDAFGKPRQGTWADANPPKLGTIANTPRGFTQHEHLNAVALIHMNGRAYDYQLGRFLSVDPVIQFPTNSQSLNPYSYLMNSPMAGTDPSGFSCKPMVGSHDCGQDTGARGGFTSNTITTKDANGTRITSTETNFSGGARGGGKMITITGRGLSNGALGGQSVSGSTTNSVAGSAQAGARNSQGGGGCGVPALCATAFALTGTDNTSPNSGMPKSEDSPELELPHGLNPDIARAAYDDARAWNTPNLEEGSIGYDHGNGIESVRMNPVAAGEIPFTVAVDSKGSVPGLRYFNHSHGWSTHWSDMYFSRNDTEYVAGRFNVPIFLRNGRGEFRVFIPGMDTGTKIGVGPDRGRKLRYGQAEGHVLCRECFPPNE